MFSCLLNILTMTNQSSFFAKSDSILENVNDNKEDIKKTLQLQKDVWPLFL